MELMGEHREAQIPNPWDEERVGCAQGATGDAVPLKTQPGIKSGIKSSDGKHTRMLEDVF